MAIKGGNPLFTVETEATDTGFMGKVFLPHLGETLEQEITPDHPLFRDFAMFGYETKVRNTIGAVTDMTKRTPEGAAERANGILDAIENGQWNTKRGEGEAAPSGGVVAQAVAQVLTAAGKPRTAAEVAAHIKAQFASIEDKKAKAAAIRGAWDTLEAREDIAPVVAKLRAEANAARLARIAAKAGEAGKGIASSLGL